jgi:hypothetical protein
MSKHKTIDTRDTVTINGLSKVESAGKALYVVKAGRAFFIPTSHVTRIHPGNTAITITRWIATQKGIT